MNTPKISIIVPVYKVEKYLRRCLDSIAAQIFTDWECILIDDGSPDNSGKICDEYAEKDNRFRVFHQDSIPDEGMVTNLLREFESFDGKIAAISPVTQNDFDGLTDNIAIVDLSLSILWNRKVSVFFISRILAAFPKRSQRHYR